MNAIKKLFKKKSLCPGCEEKKPNVEFKTSLCGVPGDVLVCYDCYNEICEDEEEQDEQEQETSDYMRELITCSKCKKYEERRAMDVHRKEEDSDGKCYYYICKECVLKKEEEADEEERKYQECCDCKSKGEDDECDCNCHEEEEAEEEKEEKEKPIEPNSRCEIAACRNIFTETEKGQLVTVRNKDGRPVGLGFICVDCFKKKGEDASINYSEM